MNAAAIKEAARANGVDARVPGEAEQERAEDADDEVDRGDVERVVEAGGTASAAAPDGRSGRRARR